MSAGTKKARLNKRQREKARRGRKAERRADQARVRIETPEPEASPNAEPLRGAEAVVIDPTRHWHIARLLPRTGEETVTTLKRADVSVFQPRTTEVVVRMRRRVVRTTQLLLRTVFIGVRNEDHLDEVRGQRGLAGIVSRPEADDGPEGNVAGMVMKPARLDPIALQGFADAVAAGEIVAAVGVRVGQSVIILTGTFAAFPAVVETVLADDKVKVGVSLFGKPVSMVLDLAHITLR